MEDKEIREKLLCVLRNHIQDFRDFKHRCVSGIAYYKDKEPSIYLHYTNIYKDVEVEKEVIIKPKYFWQKSKTEILKFTKVEIDYTTAYVDYGDFRITLLKEEYEEIMQIREEKIKEKQLEELTKLCNTTN